MTGVDRWDVTPEDVRCLLQSQFPRWADLPIERAAYSGWDNHTYRLGRDKKVRLPSASRYAAQVDKENRWLPHLAPCLPLPIPAPLAVGTPEEWYPWPWSVQCWLPGEPASRGAIRDIREFALAIAGFLRALHRIPAADGPVAGQHNFHRGGSLGAYDDETRDAIDALRDEIDADAAVSVWEAALATSWNRPPVWVHGDIAPGNLLICDGALSAVIDFGCCAVGDPACDLVIRWTLLEGDEQRVFRDHMDVDDDTWSRACGWALWKALLVMCDPAVDPSLRDQARHVVDALIADLTVG